MTEQHPRIGNLLKQRRALHAQAVDALREMIIAGRLSPGQRLVEAEFCEVFGISRTPLREALRVLEAEGLVRFMPNRGAEVTAISAEAVVQQFEVVANIERIAVELMIERASAVDLRRLTRMHDRMIVLFEQGKRRECFQKDYDIHNRIVALTGNPVLRAIYDKLMVHSRRVRYFGLHSDERWREAMAEHGAIMAALAAGRGGEAAERMRDHVLRTGEVVAAFVRANDGATPEGFARAGRT